MALAIDPRTAWYVSRASGIVAWALLALAVLWGLFLSTRTLGRTAPPAWLLDLHRHLGGLAVGFVGVHLVALMADDFTHFGWSELFVPMASTWSPGAVAWGIVAFYLLVAVEVTSLLQRRMSRRWWKRVHFSSFPLYVVATVHLFVAGTDASNAVLRWTAVITSALIALLTVVRLVTLRRRPTDSGYRSAPASRRRAISAASKPQSASTSSVC